MFYKIIIIIQFFVKLKVLETNSCRVGISEGGVNDTNLNLWVNYAFKKLNY